jgi:hypothetical protein
MRVSNAPEMDGVVETVVVTVTVIDGVCVGEYVPENAEIRGTVTCNFER